MPTKKVIAITGASSGMGKAALQLFAQRGWTVYGGARRVEKIPTGTNIHAVKLDVTDSESNHTFINTILNEQHRIDVLINNAGYGEGGPIEDIDLKNVRKQFETNFFGAAELTKLVLPTMRSQKTGRIVNISSIGGDLYMPLNAYYHASKAALQQWSDSLDLEVQQFGIRSVIVQPGGTQSAWGDIAVQNMRKNLKTDSAYLPLVNTLSNILSSSSNMISATSADLARVFYAAATDRNPKRRYFNSFGDRFVVHVARAHPKVFHAASSALLRHLDRRSHR
ncbi:SDR family NAD(P)-dependent oxidoreductase [Loigolactobacillus backii]|uniref:Short-chain dehydrogenase/reductase n=1 Tax=Loigolactobacillus backii TaxID=375175 RepID=A0A192H0Q8_9LACO|nr:SDR family NAD(P)-dependent oxidoreductase [Loigolactobacillus backii]ANK60572.1 short-chain dehydrogenase/reductase [Loigolactobacillus backii]ANK61863.1 short-chain dehydrogenase/reductase [Loigolactobacillus backii]ANK65525.1 short-chain dehydrogenase/reductase [Loigolactobacillus backii]ANK67996.1 short-chain dehydrogenase/reductase [Loigolactobacillus backii]ANK68943.1 short-chain dehydrogenase/reductase [Loigolactobacillus backii]